jgi:type I restriction enzyme M protein
LIKDYVLPNQAKQTNGSPQNLESTLWAADKLRGNLDAAEYKHVVLGLIFLKYISDSFQELYDRLAQDEYANPEVPDEYYMFVPDCKE